MNNDEILANLDFYDQDLKSNHPGIRPKRVDISANFLTFKHNSDTINYEISVGHARYLIKYLRKMIKENEKEQRIHRHYGFLQCLLLLLQDYSLEELMKDNKYGAVNR